MRTEGLVGQVSCRCCGHGEIQLPLRQALAQLLGILPEGETLTVTSGYRCDANNRACGGSPWSWHLLGLAVDVQASTLSPRDLALAATGITAFAVGGIGLYLEPPKGRGWVHLDIRGRLTRWAELRGTAGSFNALVLGQPL